MFQRVHLQKCGEVLRYLGSNTSDHFWTSPRSYAQRRLLQHIPNHKQNSWARGAPQLFATTAVRLAELVLSVRFELIASRSLTQFLCKIYAFWPFWSSLSCMRYVSYVGIKENLLGLVLRFQKIRTEKYVFCFKKYVFFA